MTTTTTEATGRMPSRWVALEDRDDAWNVLSRHQGLMGAGSGGKVDHLMTAQEVLDATDLNITVRKYPVHVDISPERDGNRLIRSKKYYMTGHEHGGELVIYGPVSDKYEIVQPVEALSIFDEVVAAHGEAYYSAAWNLPEKCRMGVTISMPEQIVVDPGGANDVLKQDLLGVNSFDGSTALLAVPIPSRIFCTNQLPSIMSNARKTGLSFKHTKTVAERARDARRILEASNAYFREWGERANRLAAKRMSDREFRTFLGKLEPFHVDPSMTELQTDRVVERIEEALVAWKAPHNENITGTRWGALNVVTEYMQWGRRVQGSPRTGTSADRQRAVGTLVHPTIQTVARQAVELLSA